MGLVSLIYVSYAKQKMSDDELVELLKECREKNAARDITGMLLYRDGFFIQALEGDAATIDAVYRKISADKRHRNILKISTENIDKRSFTDWAMGFNKIEDKDLEGIEGYTEFMKKPDPQLFTNTPSMATVLLNSFRKRNYF
ncbi:MAG: BLUF domain-containing protein [Anaerolineae bacterium]